VRDRAAHASAADSGRRGGSAHRTLIDNLQYMLEHPDIGRRALSWRSNSGGESGGILTPVKTQASDTKLVAQMQPYDEAYTLERATLDGRSVPMLVTQIADGENGEVMMNEFPPKYREVVRESSDSETPTLNGTEKPGAGLRERRARARPARDPAAVAASHLGRDGARRRARAPGRRDRGVRPARLMFLIVPPT
jgi:hypothetical protein